MKCNKSTIILFMALMAAQLSFSLSATAAIHHVSGGAGALTAVHDTASADDVIIIDDSLGYNGLYLNRRLTIQAAEGQHPYFLNNMWGTRALYVGEQGPTNRGHDSTLIGLTFNVNITASSMTVQVDPSATVDTDPNPMTFQDCTFKVDTPGGNQGIFLIDAHHPLHLINCTFSRNDGFDNGMIALDKGGNTFENCTFGPAPSSILAIIDNAPSTALPSTMIDCSFQNLTGSFYALDVRGSGNRTWNFVHCTFPQSVGGALRDLSTNVGTYNFERCFLGPRGGGYMIDAGNVSGSTFSFTNCVIYGDDAQDKVIGSVQKSNNWHFKQCSFIELKPYGARKWLHLGSTNDNVNFDFTGATNSTFEFQNCLFNAPGCENYMVLGTVGAKATFAPNVTAGTNLFNTVSADADDALRGKGTEILADPLLGGASGYLLSDTSPALGKGADLGIAMDIDGKARPTPAGTDPDLGASESYLVPVELSSFNVD